MENYIIGEIMNQGKRDDQIEFSNWMAFGSIMTMIIILLIAWIWKIIV